MAEIVHFSEAKADMSGDSRDWTTLDMLKALVRDVESGKSNPDGMCIHFWEKSEDGIGRAHNFFIAGMTFTEHVALLSVAIHETIGRFQNSD